MGFPTGFANVFLASQAALRGLCAPLSDVRQGHPRIRIFLPLFTNGAAPRGFAEDPSFIATVGPGMGWSVPLGSSCHGAINSTADTA